MSPIKKLQDQMVLLSQENKLPENYKTNVADDITSLATYDGLTLVWLLRTNGSVLVPVMIGADPVYITHWLWGNHGQDVKAFSINTVTGLIEKIDFEQAEKLIHQPPLSLTRLMGQEDLVKQVDEILNSGCRRGIWGIFKHPASKEEIGNWGNWQRYFSDTNNRMMANFIGKAISLLNRPGCSTA